MAKYRIANIKLKPGEGWEALPLKIEKKCGLHAGYINAEDLTVIRESIDARDKKNIQLVYTLDFNWKGKLPGRMRKQVIPAPDLTLPEPEPGDEALSGRPVVVGFGPCGIFAALALARAGYAPIVVERGADMENRVADVDAFWKKGQLKPESNVLFGEGGAGTFSDGKLTTGIKDPHIRQVLTDFVEAGAPEDILYKQKPHIGTDVLRKVVVNLRRGVEAAGGEVRFETCMTAIKTDEAGRICAVELKNEKGIYELATNAVILAPGHSARDTFRYLNKTGVPMAQKPFSIGVRIEHPQALIDKAQYGDTKGLPPADYKLSCHTEDGRGVYSFCMCPGGEVITATTEEGLLCVNGMSNRNRDSGVANAGILVDVRTSDFGSDDVLAGVAFQEKWERRAFEEGGGHYAPPRCSWSDFRDQTLRGQKVAACLPDFAVSALKEGIPGFGRRIAGFDSEDARLTAVETRSSSPVRILRGEDFQSEMKGLYPAGEGAGYAGGITSAACDGLRAARAIISRFKPWK